MFERPSEWDSMKTGLANQVTLQATKSTVIASDAEIVTRSEDFANFQYLVGNESLSNKQHVTEIDIHESNIDENSKTYIAGIEKRIVSKIVLYNRSYPISDK